MSSKQFECRYSPKRGERELREALIAALMAIVVLGAWLVLLLVCYPALDGSQDPSFLKFLTTGLTLVITILPTAYLWEYSARVVRWKPRQLDRHVATIRKTRYPLNNEVNNKAARGAEEITCVPGGSMPGMVQFLAPTWEKSPKGYYEIDPGNYIRVEREELVRGVRSLIFNDTRH